jgi:hypothetical protein
MRRTTALVHTIFTTSDSAVYSGRVQYTELGPSPPDLALSFSWLLSPVTKLGVCATGVVLESWENPVNIFVGNLPFTTNDEQLRSAFSKFGTVESAQVIQDRETGRSRGFGFVEMPNADEGRAAIAGMNGADMGGRPLTVNEARPKAPRTGGGGGGGGRRW